MTMLKIFRRTEVQINHRDLHKEMISQNYISIKQKLVSRKSGI